VIISQSSRWLPDYNRYSNSINNLVSFHVLNEVISLLTQHGFLWRTYKKSSKIMC